MRAARVSMLVGLVGLVAGAALVAGCEPRDRPPPKSAKQAACPKPKEPDHQAVVVGTIGKLHLVESRYPLSRLGDVLATFKPDLVLLDVRVEAYRDEELEDAPFEMTYVQYLARQHGVPVEPIGWFRDKDLGAPAPAFDPWDAAEIAKKESAMIGEPALFTFEQANGAELESKVMAANNALVRYRGGDAIQSRRRAWMQYLAASAVERHGRPSRVLAYVNVFDRPAIDLELRGVGYAPKSPVEIVDKAKEVMLADVSPAVISAYKAQLGRVRDKIEDAKGKAKERWEAKQQVLEVVVDKQAQCCVTQAALEEPDEK